MKRLSIALLFLGAGMAPLEQLHSQSASTPAASAVQPMVTQVTINIVPQLKSPLAQLEALKAANQTMLEQQAKTLQALDDLQKQAEELKVFGKRS